MPQFETEIIEGAPAGIAGDSLRGRPVSGECLVTDVFGTPRNNGIGYHPALDLAPLVSFAHEREYCAIAPGPLLWVGVGVRGPGGRNLNGGYGNVALVGHEEGTQTLGAHLREFSPRIQAWIDAGFPPDSRPYLEADELIGIVGNTGYVWPEPVDAADDVRGVHLHFECRDGAGGYIDPVRWMVDVDEVHPAPAPDLPPAVEEERPPLLKIGPIGAFNEARLTRRLFELLAESPGENRIDDVAQMYEREAAEILVALGGYAYEGIEGEDAAIEAARELAAWMHRLGGLYRSTIPTVSGMAGTGAALAGAIVDVLRPVVAV